MGLNTIECPYIQNDESFQNPFKSVFLASPGPSRSQEWGRGREGKETMQYFRINRQSTVYYAHIFWFRETHDPSWYVPCISRRQNIGQYSGKKSATYVRVYTVFLAICEVVRASLGSRLKTRTFFILFFLFTLGTWNGRKRSGAHSVCNRKSTNVWSSLPRYKAK